MGKRVLEEIIGAVCAAITAGFLALVVIRMTASEAAAAGRLALGFLLLLIGGGFYLVPGFAASYREHRNAKAIWALDILLGWTFIGWVVALVWALTSPAPVPQEKANPGWHRLQRLSIFGIYGLS
ncbi:MAG: superinfection immunity protein [Candidatus Binataceae bacterium]